MSFLYQNWSQNKFISNLYLGFGVILLLVCNAIQVKAQDTHHWGNQFGTRAALLGGAVLTDTVDNAGVFYNPGNLGYLDTTSLTINANLYGLENIKIENALGQRADFKGLRFNTVPLLISGSIQTKSSWNLSYGLLTPVSFNFNGVARIEGNFEIAPENISPGKEEVVSESGINTKLQETTLAVGFGKKLSPNLGFGLSLLNTIRTVDYSYRFSAKTLTNSQDYYLISRTQNEFINYFALRTALKVGLNFQKESYGLGIAVTTPSLDWLGNGTVAEDLTLTNLPVQGIARPVNAYASDRQEKLKTTYKSPFEIAFGAHKAFNRSILSLNVTHFGGFDKYRIIDAEPGVLVRPEEVDQAFDNEDFLNVETAMKPVTNVAIGYENQLKETLTLLASFRTDFSYFDDKALETSQMETEITQWDIFHLSLGTEIKKSRSSLTLGLIYSFGSTQDYLQRGSFNNVEADQILEGALVITKASYSNFGLLIGYSFNFKKFN